MDIFTNVASSGLNGRNYNGDIARYRNGFLIYNPRAGKLQRGGDLIGSMVDVLRRSGHNVTVVPTTGPNTASDIARECIRKQADLILAAGGDGTMNEVLNGMVGSEVPLGIMPGGTANVLAMELRLGTQMLRSAEMLSSWIPERIAVGRLLHNGQTRHFALMAGIGLDALVVYNIHAGLKSALGKGAYWIAGFRQLGKRLAEFTVTVEARTYRASFALASRVRNYGGDLEIARSASLLNDQFELVLFEGAQSLLYTKYLAGVLTKRLDNMKGVTVLRARSIELSHAEDSRVYVQVDGEYVCRLPVRIDIAPSALTLLVPPGYRRQAVAS